jgi:triacylglycerol lipase
MEEIRPQDALVVLVHGFMRTGASMMLTSARLKRAGYLPRPVTQLNIHREIPDLADQLYHRVLRFRDAAERQRGRPVTVHFVTHSMGGIVVRSMLARHEIAGINRVVMLAPPNQGARFAAHMYDKVLRLPWGDFDPLRKLLPGERGDCEGAGDPDAEIGIIAGAPTRPTGFPWNLAQDNPLDVGGAHDGKVAVDEARLAGAQDFLVLPYGHTWIMSWPAVIDQVEAFLRTGAFHRPA